MNELTKKEKAARYDEASKWMENVYPTLSHEQQMEAEAFFPMFKKSEDERTREEIVRFIQMEVEDEIVGNRWLAWLEKQGGHEPADKVEPKFKVGDFITNDILVGEIDEIHKYGYHAYFGDYYADVADVENWHKWTIQDAKDGDVLCCDSGWTCIFKALDNHANTFSSYCFMDSDKWFCDTGSECHTLDKAFVKAYNGEIHPTTKEQRDTLMKVMADAGYTFDFEKKELKKIEQSPIEEVNGEDYGIDGLWHAQRILEKTLGSVDGYQSDDGILEHKCAINAVKELYEQKPAWSEEEEKMLDTVIEDIIKLAGPKVCYHKDVDWLKALKERYTWKPSEKQIHALKEAAQGKVTRRHIEYTHHLRTLLEQLNKL